MIATAATIERIDTLLVDVPTIRPHKLSVATMNCQTLVLVRVRCTDGIEGVGDGSLSHERSGTEHELVAQLRFMFRHQVGGRITIGCPQAELLDLDMLVAKRDRTSNIVDAFLPTGTD